MMDHSGDESERRRAYNEELLSAVSPKLRAYASRLIRDSRAVECLEGEDVTSEALFLLWRHRLCNGEPQSTIDEANLLRYAYRYVVDAYRQRAMFGYKRRIKQGSLSDRKVREKSREATTYKDLL